MSFTFLAVAFVICSVAVALVARPLFGTSSVQAIVTLAIGLPAFCVGVYLFLGSPGMQDSEFPHRSTASQSGAAQASSSDGGKVDSVASLLEGLESRLTDNPEDSKGWLLLSRSYEHVGRVDDAIAAYGKAVALGEYDADLAALTSADFETNELITSQATIVGSVTVSDRAAMIVEPTDTVFVFARATGASGVPAAVQQQLASNFPIAFHLDDSTSMVDGIKLSDFEKVDITARISRTGSAMEALQDLEAKSSGVVVSDGSEIHLVIE